MRILSVKPGHDGSVAYVDGGRLLFCFEAEKGSYPRYSGVTAELMFEALQAAPAPPDVLAIGGWHKHIPGIDTQSSAGYHGLQNGTVDDGRLFGAPVKIFSSTHERSHIMMAAGMHPMAPLERCTVLVWEGTFGAFYDWRSSGRVIRRHHVMTDPGAKYGALFALADPNFTDGLTYPRMGDAGKLMALSAFGEPSRTTSAVRATVEHLLALPKIYPLQKRDLRDSALYNAGLDSRMFRDAAAYLTDRIFDTFHAAARHIEGRGYPLVISGGCGLNCDWNQRWRHSGLFSDVFVPPCANDSGSAIGTAVDAQVHLGSPARLTWSVYAGGRFITDCVPEPARWQKRRLDLDEVARRIQCGEIVAWVQGRYEIGPRALGNRSLLADPTRESMRDRLNQLKGREDYRPIAPCCRVEEVRDWFSVSEPDPYMLFFSDVTTKRLPAVTHVDGTARVQSVARTANARLHDLLSTLALRTGLGVLCNTSLNFSGMGFINRMSELEAFCSARDILVFVVDDEMFTRVPHPAA